MDDVIVVVDHIVVHDDGVVDVVVLCQYRAPMVMPNVVVDNLDVTVDVVVVDGSIHNVEQDYYILLDHDVLGLPNILLFDPCCCYLGTYNSNLLGLVHVTCNTSINKHTT